MNRKNKITVLMSAYACEPYRGSEPAVGWNWAWSMAKHVNVTVLTRSNNESVIADYLNSYKNEECAPQFIYYDPPRPILYLKKKKVLPVQIFYIIWQLGASWKLRKNLLEYDIVHHVTFNSMMSPGFWWSKKTPIILGPLGGTSCVRDEYKALYGSKIWKENLRRFFINHWNYLPWLRLSFRRAALILCANSETKRFLSSGYKEKIANILETGINESDECSQAGEEEGLDEVSMIWVGAVEPWKALKLALVAFSIATKELGNTVNIKMHIVGDGSELDESIELAQNLGVEDDIVFHGSLPLSETASLIHNSDFLIFSSIKDTSGNVVLEAMNAGKPVICIKHQGVEDITTDETAIRVQPGLLDETQIGIADAIIKLAKSPHLRAQLGRAGRERILKVYRWEKKAICMFGFYKRVLVGREK